MRASDNPDQAANPVAVNAAALRALSRREYSEFELRSKLERRFDQQVVEQVLESLVADHLLSDERFTEVFVRSRIARGQGPTRIRQELRQRGIGDELVSHFLSFDSEFWLEHAREVAERRGSQLAETRSDDPEVRHRARGKLGRFLAGRGFPMDVISQILR
jgi:regulatory protein